VLKPLANSIKRKHPIKGEEKVKAKQTTQKTQATKGSKGIITKYRNLHQRLEAYQLKKSEDKPHKPSFLLLGPEGCEEAL